MLKIERIKKIKKLMYENGTVLVADLSEKFSVSEETIRRDLEELEKMGISKKVYGGAFLANNVKNSVNINLRENIHVVGKKQIAEICAPYIKDYDSIFLDGSTTSIYIANLILHKNITLVTNSLKITNMFAEVGNKNTFFLGGKIDSKTLTSLGKVTEGSLKNYFFDVSIVSCNSISMDYGLSDPDEQQAEIRKIALKNSKKKLLAMDYTKFNKMSFSKICDFDNIDILVTDSLLDSQWKKFLKDNNIDFIEATKD